MAGRVAQGCLGTRGGRWGRLCWRLPGEACPTLAAERKLGWVLKGTLRAVMTQRCPATATKVRAFQIVQGTAWAAHMGSFWTLGQAPGLHARASIMARPFLAAADHATALQHQRQGA